VTSVAVSTTSMKTVRITALRTLMMRQ
jgi:hypothetical protein